MLSNIRAMIWTRWVFIAMGLCTVPHCHVFQSDLSNTTITLMFNRSLNSLPTCNKNSASDLKK